MSYTYDIRPSPNPQRGGWNLHLFEDGAAAGLIDFPAAEYGHADADATKVAFARAEAEASLWVKDRKVYLNRRRRLNIHPAVAILVALAVAMVFYDILQYIL